MRAGDCRPKQAEAAPGALRRRGARRALLQTEAEASGASTDEVRGRLEFVAPFCRIWRFPVICGGGFVAVAKAATAAGFALSMS